MTHRESQTLAYHNIQDNGLLPRMRWLVYDTIYRHQGDEGVTSGEVDRIITRDKKVWTRSASPRLNELVKLGVLEELPLRTCRSTKQSVIAYRTTDKLPDPSKLKTRTKPMLKQFLTWWRDDPDRKYCTLNQAAGAYMQTFPGRTIKLLIELLCVAAHVSDPDEQHEQGSPERQD